MSENIPQEADPHVGWSGATPGIPEHSRSPHPDAVSFWQPPTPHSWLARYAVALALVLTAFGLRYAIYSDLDFRLPFAFFSPAAFIAAWYGGLGPGALVAISGLLLGDIFFLPPHEAMGSLTMTSQLSVGSYSASTAVGVGLIEHLHLRIRRLTRQLAEARAAQPGAASEGKVA